MVDIFKAQVKETINCSLSSKSIMIVGKSKSGKSTLASQAPKPIFLMTENGGEVLTGFTPIPIASWSDFKSAVTQLCSQKARERFETVVIDTYTNLILLLDKYCGSKMSTDKNTLDFSSEADYGKGTRVMKNELGIQLQKLANQGYLILNIVHAEDKIDFNTQKPYIGTSLSNQLYGVAEKFVDQIIFLKKEIINGNTQHKIWFNGKGGFEGAGGRFTPEVDSVPCSFENLKNVLIETMKKVGETNGIKLVESDKPSVIIETEQFDFTALKTEFENITSQLITDSEENIEKIRNIVSKVLGSGKKVSDLNANQAELLAEVIAELKNEFNI